MAVRPILAPLLVLIVCSLPMAAQGATQGRALVLRFASRNSRDSDFNVPKVQLHKGLRAGSAGSQRLRGPGQFAGGDPAAMAEEAFKEAEALGYKLDKKFPTMAMRWTNKQVINYMKAHPGPWGAVKLSMYSGGGNTPFMLASKEVQFGGGCTVSWNFIKPSSPKEVVLKGFVRNLRYFMMICGTGFKKK